MIKAILSGPTAFNPLQFLGAQIYAVFLRASVFTMDYGNIIKPFLYEFFPVLKSVRRIGDFVCRQLAIFTHTGD